MQWHPAVLVPGGWPILDKGQEISKAVNCRDEVYA